MVVEFGDYEGHPMIILKRSFDDRYPFQFGVAKAKLIVENIVAIEKFILENDMK